MQKKFGATFLSTPAVDPDEKDSKMIERWRKINKVEVKIE